MSASPTERTSHARSLDALRGMLAVVVVAAHACQIFSYPQTGWIVGLPARAACDRGAVRACLHLEGGQRTAVLIVLIAYVSAFGIVGLKLRTLTYLAFAFGAMAYVVRGTRGRTLLMGLGISIPIAAAFGIWASSIPMLHLDGSWVWISMAERTGETRGGLR